MNEREEEEAEEEEKEEARCYDHDVESNIIPLNFLYIFLVIYYHV